MRERDAEENYVIVEFAKMEGTRNRVCLTNAKSGTGGHREVHDFMKENQDKVLFIALKVIGTCEMGTIVPKFVFFKFCTNKAVVRVRARITMFQNQIKTLLSGGAGFANNVELDDDWEDEFETVPVGKLLVKSWFGSDKPDKIDLGGGDVYDVESGSVVG